jgi:hypothetical protein
VIDASGNPIIVRGLLEFGVEDAAGAVLPPVECLR